MARPPKGPQARPRTASRVAAVQALFQSEQGGETAETVIDQFVRHRLGEMPGPEHLAEAVALSDRIAPEHLELCVDDPEALAGQVHHAGAIFLGGWTPEAAGDYVSGPNHVLPTARSARFSSGLSVMDFLKRTTLSRLDPASLAAIGPAAVRLALSEGLSAHARSIEARLATLNRG